MLNVPRCGVAHLLIPKQLPVVVRAAMWQARLGRGPLCFLWDSRYYSSAYSRRARGGWHVKRQHTGELSRGGIYVYVDDVDAHYAHARDAGARILKEPEDQFFGDRNYRVEDLEGHQWAFAQHVRDVPPEESEPAQ